MNNTPFTLVIHLRGGVLQDVYSDGPMHDLVTVYLQDDDEIGPPIKIPVEVEPEYIKTLFERDN